MSKYFSNVCRRWSLFLCFVHEEGRKLMQGSEATNLQWSWWLVYSVSSFSYKPLLCQERQDLSQALDSYAMKTANCKLFITGWCYMSTPRSNTVWIGGGEGGRENYSEGYSPTTTWKGKPTVTPANLSNDAGRANISTIQQLAVCMSGRNANFKDGQDLSQHGKFQIQYNSIQTHMKNNGNLI